MDENAVIEAVCAYLTQNGYEVEQRLHTTQQGIDIIARQASSGQRLYIEAKGATSSIEGSARFGKGFTASQVYDRVSKGIYAGLRLRAAHPDRAREDVGLAFPDTPQFRKLLEPVSKQLSDASLAVFLASPDGHVTRL
ncbi:MAG: restriction endonuclease [Pirellulales bacterium]